MHAARASNSLQEIDFLKKLQQTVNISYTLFLSSAAVYGEQGSIASDFSDIASTNSDPNPISDYGHNKLAVEKWLSENTMLSCSARISNPFGKEFDTSKFNAIVQNKTANVLKTGNFGSFDLNCTDDKPIIRDFIHINQLIEKLITLLEPKATGVYNLSSGYGVSLEEFITMSAAQYIFDHYVKDINEDPDRLELLKARLSHLPGLELTEYESEGHLAQQVAEQIFEINYKGFKEGDIRFSVLEPSI